MMRLPVMHRSVIIVAGGKGLRMGGELPKQFLPVRGVPVLMRTVGVFHDFDPGMPVVVVLPVAHQGYWHELCRRYSFGIPHVVADGGETRFHSVRSGLSHLPSDGLIAVHDGVRPFVSTEVIGRCFDAAAGHGAAVPVIRVHETMRRVDDAGGSVTVSRDDYRLVQTPQVFDARLLHEAYDCDYRAAFTDDASVVEAAGHAITLVEGNRENIKLTTPFDMTVAEALL